jgi:putative membrane protein
MATRAEKIGLVVSYLLFAALLGIRPVDRQDWALENSVPFLEGLAAVLYCRWRKVELTRLSYYLVWVHLLVQVIGGHYTYEKVPLFDWLRDTLHWSRNHYDRLAHFALGFCLYIPIREICRRRSPLRSSRLWTAFLSLSVVAALAGLWEVWEWLVAVLAHPELGAAYLGLQGDPWDPQKDILLAPVGAVLALLFLTRPHDRLLGALPETAWRYPLSSPRS